MAKKAAAPGSGSLRAIGVLMITLGTSAVVIGLSIYVIGGAATGSVTQELFARVTSQPHPAAWSPDSTMESEFGFYAPLWIAFGIVLIVTARDLPRTLERVPILSALFFAGGVGRGLAWARAGPPRSAFAFLMMIELITPILLIALWAMARLPGPHQQTTELEGP